MGVLVWIQILIGLAIIVLITLQPGQEPSYSLALARPKLTRRGMEKLVFWLTIILIVIFILLLLLTLRFG